MEMPHLKIQRRLLFTSVLMFCILALVVVLSILIIQRKSQIQEALSISEQSREQLQRTEGLNEALLNVDLAFRKYCITFSTQHFQDYRFQVDTLTKRIARIAYESQNGQGIGDERISRMLGDKENEAGIYARLKQLNDSLIFSVADLSARQESITQQLNAPDPVVRIDTLRSVETNQRQRKGLFGRIKTALVGEKVTDEVKTTVVVVTHETAGATADSVTVPAVTDSLTTVTRADSLKVEAVTDSLVAKTLPDSVNIEPVADSISAASIVAPVVTAPTAAKPTVKATTKPTPEVDQKETKSAVSAMELAQIGSKLKMSELRLISLNGNLIAEIRSLVASLKGIVQQAEAIRNQTFLNSIHHSTELLPRMLMLLIATGVCLIAYILVLAFKNGANQKQIVALNAQIQQDLLEKDKFLSIIGHDLKNPFNALLGFSDILKETAITGSRQDIREYSEVVNNSARRVFNLVHNLLVWSRINNGKIGFSPVPVLLGKFVSENMEVMAPIAQNKEIDLTWQVDEGLRTQLDKNMISSVIQNLVTNAIKFTPRGGKVTLTATAQGDKIKFDVADNGIGMDQEQLSKTFKLTKDYRTQGTDKEEGSGLGLIISKEFVEAHHGMIGVESTPGEGSRFWFEIPLTAPAEPPTDKPA